MPPTGTPSPVSKDLYRISEAMQRLSLSRTVIYEQIRTGRLRTVKQGRTRLVPAAAIAEYIALLETEAAQAETLKGAA
jgi:excisionase family DNA binding protein